MNKFRNIFTIPLLAMVLALTGCEMTGESDSSNAPLVLGLIINGHTEDGENPENESTAEIIMNLTIDDEENNWDLCDKIFIYEGFYTITAVNTMTGSNHMRMVICVPENVASGVTYTQNSPEIRVSFLKSDDDPSNPLGYLSYQMLQSEGDTFTVAIDTWDTINRQAVGTFGGTMTQVIDGNPSEGSITITGGYFDMEIE